MQWALWYLENFNIYFKTVICTWESYCRAEVVTRGENPTQWWNIKCAISQFEKFQEHKL